MIMVEFIAVPGRVRYVLIWEVIEINGFEPLICTSC